MLHKWWGVGLVVILGLVWLALGERPGAEGKAAPPPALRAQEQVPAHGAEPPTPADSQAQLLEQSAPTAPVQPMQLPAAPAPPAAAEDSSVEHALALRQAGDEAGAVAALRRAIQDARTVEQAARAGLFLAASVSDLAERRQYISTAIEADVVHGEEYEQVGAALRELNASAAVSLQPLIATESYTVASGDSLWKLCNRTLPERFGVTPEVGLLRVVNGLPRDTLKSGQVLKVPKQPLVVKVNTREHGLTAWLGDVAVASYRVGLGRDDSTPHRTFSVLVKQENPDWFYAGRTIPFGDPENILGTRWMGFDSQTDASGFGIHGTAFPESIGKNESMGCVRMRNGEVEELFELVPRGARVTIF
jgi:nucleoid-associated protein YgaU